MHNRHRPEVDYWEGWARERNLPAIEIADYKNLSNFDHLSKLVIIDHIEGFDKNLYNPLLDYLNQRPTGIELWLEQLIDDRVKQLYPNINFRYDASLQDANYFHDYYNLKSLVPDSPKTTFEGLLTCFNRGGHVGRQFLVSGLFKLKLWDSKFCSKESINSREQVDGNISFYFENDDDARYYRKFLIDDRQESNEFYEKKFVFHDQVEHVRFDNLLLGLSQVSSTFLSLISETKPESYHPYVTEKFLFPVITKNVWLAYAQPNFHSRIEKCYGYKLYKKIFDYSFDSITNPVERVVALLTMILKFKNLTVDDWVDLYRMEQDTIDYNYDHYFSKGYLTHLKQFEY